MIVGLGFAIWGSFEVKVVECGRGGVGVVVYPGGIKGEEGRRRVDQF